MKNRFVLPALAVAALAFASLSGCGSDQVATSSGSPGASAPAPPPPGPASSGATTAARSAPVAPSGTNQFAAGASEGDEAVGQGLASEPGLPPDESGAAGEGQQAENFDRTPPAAPPGSNAGTGPPSGNDAVASASSGNVGFEIGDVAPEIVGRDVDGVDFKLSDYRGKVVVLDFWGDW